MTEIVHYSNKKSKGQVENFKLFHIKFTKQFFFRSKEEQFGYLYLSTYFYIKVLVVLIALLR